MREGSELRIGEDILERVLVESLKKRLGFSEVKNKWEVWRKQQLGRDEKRLLNVEHAMFQSKE